MFLRVIFGLDAVPLFFGVVCIGNLDMHCCYGERFFFLFLFRFAVECVKAL